MSYDKQAQAEKEQNQELLKEHCKKEEKEENRKELQHFQEMQISDDESNKSVSSLEQNIASGEISSSGSD